MSEQSLPTYVHNFERETRWKRVASTHYVFNYFADSEAEKDIETIVSRQEDSYAKIMGFLGLPDPGKPIEYFFYPDAGTKKLLMGDDWYAQAIYDEFRVHVLYTADIKPLGEHEDTHLLSLPWGLAIGFFQEGLAEYMVGHAWDGRSHASYVREGYEQGLYPALATFMDHGVWLATDDSKPLYFYSLVGAVTAFLIERFGKDKFESLYKALSRDLSGEENLRTFEILYGSVGKIERDFKDSLVKST